MAEIKRWDVRGRNLMIFPTPNKDVPNGLKIEFNPSKYWIKKHPYLNPIITTDILKGQQTYYLPPYFNKKTIRSIQF